MSDGKLSINKIIQNSKIAVNNTWVNYNEQKNTAIRVNEEFLELVNLDLKVVIDSFDESVLSVITDYSYLPKKFVLDTLAYKNKLNNNTPESILSSWINIGLIWLENNYISDFIRPTNLLYSLFDIKNPGYTEINFSQYVHDMSEAKIMLEILTGKKDNIIVKYFSSIVRDKESKFSDKYKIKHSKGLNIITEKEYRTLYASRSIKSYTVYKMEELIQTQIESGIRETQELIEHGCFPIAILEDSSQDLAVNGYQFIYPDITVPIQRKSDGTPQSISIEMELSAKSLTRYKNLMKYYKNNNKYGYLVYYYTSDKILDRINQAIEYVDGLGTCKFIPIPFEIPKI